MCKEAQWLKDFKAGNNLCHFLTDPSWKPFFVNPSRIQWKRSTRELLETKKSDENYEPEEQTVTEQISNWVLRKIPENRYCCDQRTRVSVFLKPWDTRQHLRRQFFLENLGAES